MTEKRETVIWDAFKEGSETAFRQLYDHYYTALVNYGYKFTQDQDLVESAIQDLFLLLWKKRDTIQPVISIKNYLFVSFRRSLARSLSRAKIHIPLTDTDAEYHFEFAFDPESDLISRERLLELQQKLRSALDKMNARQREVIYLKYYENLSYDEIAVIMGISVKGTYKLVYRAIDTLKDHLGNFMLLALYAIISSGYRQP